MIGRLGINMGPPMHLLRVHHAALLGVIWPAPMRRQGLRFYYPAPRLRVHSKRGSHVHKQLNTALLHRKKYIITQAYKQAACLNIESKASR